MTTELPIVTRLREHATECDGEPMRDECTETGANAGDLREAATLIEEMAEALRDAPIIGRNESPDAFRKRQDEWLNGKCRQALARVQP